MRRAIFIGAASALLAGCMVGPNFRQPDAPTAPRYTEADLPGATASAPGAAGSTQRFAPGQDLPAQWWTLFHSDPLDQLVRQAIADSPNLTAAEAALRVARENLAAQTGALLYPQVDGTLGASRQKITGASFGPARWGRHDIQSVQRVGQRVLCARRRRPQPARARSAAIAGRLSGVPACRRPSRIDVERRHCRHQGSIAARADRFDARHHRLPRTSRSTWCGANSSSGRSAGSTW